MRVEGAAGEADVRRPIGRKSLHQVGPAGEHADRQPAAECLAVGDEIGPNSEILLRAAAGEAEAGEDLVHDEDDAALGADLADFPEPVGIGRLVEARRARAVDKGAVAGARRSDGAPGEG
jgi:hypothetical protein